MEWFGINLNHQRQNLWYKKTILIIIALFISFIFSFFIALNLYYLSNNFQSEYIFISKDITDKQDKLTKLKYKIDNIKSGQKQDGFSALIPKGEASKIIDFIQNIFPNGGLNILNLVIDEGLQVTLNGKLSSDEFERLEQKLKQENKIYKITLLQADEQQFLDFNLIVEWGEQNEKMVE